MKYKYYYLLFSLVVFGELTAQNNVTIPPCVDCPTGGGVAASASTCNGFDEIITYGYNREAQGQASEMNSFLSGNNKIYTATYNSQRPGENTFNISGGSGTYDQLLAGFPSINEDWVDFAQADVNYTIRGGAYTNNYYFALASNGDLYFKGMYHSNYFQNKIPLTGGALATILPAISSSDPLIVNSGVLNTLGAPLKFSHFLEAENYAYSAHGVHAGFAYSEDDHKVYSWGGRVYTTYTGGGGLASYAENPAGQLLLRPTATTTLSSSTPMPTTKINDVIERHGTRLKVDDPDLDFKSGFSDNFLITAYASGSGSGTTCLFITEDGVVNYVNDKSAGNLRIVLPNGEKVISISQAVNLEFYLTSDAGLVYKVALLSYNNSAVIGVDEIINITSAHEFFKLAGDEVISIQSNFNSTDIFALTADGDLLKRIDNTTYEDFTALYNIPKIGKIFNYESILQHFIIAETKFSKQIIYIETVNNVDFPIDSNAGGVYRDLNGAPFIGDSRWSLGYSCGTYE